MQFFTPSYSHSRGNRQFFARTFLRAFVLGIALCSLATVAGLFWVSDKSASAVQSIPYRVNFQGRLTNSSSNIVADGLYNIQFKLYDAASAGTLLWSETRETTNRVQVTNGLFSVQLGSVTALSPTLFNNASARYFEITMATPATATCSTASCAVWESPMTPRQALAASTYAMNSDTLDGLDSSDFAAASGSANYIQNTSSPQAGNFNITGSGTIGVNLNIDGVIYGKATAMAGDVMHVGNDSKLSDVNIANTLAVIGIQDATKGCIQLSNSTASVVCGSGGNAGVGVSNPGFKWDVQGGDINTSGSYLMRGAATNGSIFSAANGYLNIRTGTTALNIDNNAGTTNLLTVSDAGAVNVVGGPLQTGGTQRLDASGNLSNIGTYSGSGNITTSGKYLQGTFLDGTPTNYLPNGSFETDTAGWGANALTTLARTTTQSYVGAASLNVKYSGAGDGYASYTLPTVPTTFANRTYTFSLWAKASLATNTLSSVLLQTTGASFNDICSLGVITLGTSWQQYKATCTVPAGYTNTTWRAILRPSTDSTVEVYYDGITIQSGTSATQYTNISADDSGNTVLYDGNLGIGVASPTGKLHVAGTIIGSNLVSNVATGTAPLTVSSTTMVTNLNSDMLDGQHGSYYQDASNLNTGTVASARLLGSYTGITGVGTLTAGTWQGSTIGAAYGGTGLNTSTAANGSLLIGNGAGLSLATLTAGSGITITNSAGGITITNSAAAGSYVNLQGTTPGTAQTGHINVTGTIIGSNLVSNVATGTAPLTVSSTTKVTNLNTDLLDGLDSSYFAASTGSANYIQNTTSPQTANFNITGSATVGSLVSNGNITILNGQGINSSGDSVRFHTDRADDAAYEWLGFYSGATRQGILIYDAAWTGCRNIATELCLKAENGNTVTLASDTSVTLLAKGTGDIRLDAGSGQILAINNGTNSSPAYSFSSNAGFGMWITSATELALGTSSTARLVLSGSSAELWMGTTQRSERMCHNRGNAPATAGLAIIGDCSAGGSDFAEYYGSPGDVPVATIVEYDESKPIEYLIDPTDTSRMGNKAFVKTATNRSKSLGVYSTNPFVDILGKEYYSSSDNIIPIGLAGRVPVRVNTSNGPIAVGDPIALSSTPGVGAKAVTPGQIIGYSMQAYSGEGEGTVVALISTGYWAPSDADVLQGQAATLDTLTVSGGAEIASLTVTGTTTLAALTVTGGATFQGELTVIGALKTGTLTVNGHILGNNDTRGEVTVKAEQREAVLTFGKPYDVKPFVVASPVTQSVAYRLDITKEGFKVILDSVPSKDITFNYMVQQ